MKIVCMDRSSEKFGCDKREERGLEKAASGFPGGAVVKNPLANAGDMGSSPGPGRSHMSRSNEVCVPQLLSLCATTTEARTPRRCAPQQEKPPQ